MSTVFTHRIVPSIDKARGLLALNEFSVNPLVDVHERFARTVVDTRDKAIRDALIALGWTPPPGTSPVVDDTPTRLRHRSNDPGTSVAAAERAAEFAGSHKVRILRALEGGVTRAADQIARLSGLTVVQVDRRMHELQREGLVELGVGPYGADTSGGYRLWKRTPSRA
jgi:DNA-binding HxlR family transcriptional regulator